MAEPLHHETARLVLRDWSDGDAEELHRISNTPEVMRWLGGVMDEAKWQAQLERISSWPQKHGFTFWIVERKDDGGHLAGEMLGICGLKRADAPNSPMSGMMEVGWRFRQSSWGHGYAKEAATAALDLGFGRFGADEIVALTVDGNAPSWGLMQRLGMRRRNEFDYVDERYAADLNPTIAHSITREVWEKGKDG